MVPLGGFTHPGECPPAQEGPSLSPCNSQAVVGFQPPGERQSLHVGVTAGPGVPAGAVAPSSLQTPWQWVLPGHAPAAGRDELC